MVGAIVRDTLRNLAPDGVEISLEAGMNQSARFWGPIDLRVGRFVVVIVRLGTTEGQQGVGCRWKRSSRGRCRALLKSENFEYAVRLLYLIRFFRTFGAKIKLLGGHPRAALAL
jgi:hypothetical protein